MDRVIEDRELVGRIRSGDAGAFRLLVDQYQRLVMHVVFRLVDGPEDREELCQDVFVRIHLKLGQFNFESKLSTWIAQIAYRTCLNFLSRKRLPIAEEPPHWWAGESGESSWLDRQADDGPSPAETLAGEEAFDLVRQSVSRLPPLLKTVITLYHLEDMSVAEIGTVTGLPAGTIKSHLFRARQILTDQLVRKLGNDTVP